MLSRIAESLFWIGRYCERADDTARLLDVHMHLLIEDPWADETMAGRTLLAVMGADEQLHASQDVVLELLAHSAVSPFSIASCLSAARENARRAREVVPAELWEALNSTWLALQTRQRQGDAPYAFLRWARERVTLVTGVVESTMVRDEGWQFLSLGRHIERADMTSRIVASATLSSQLAAMWTVVLRSCGGYDAYLRTYRGERGEARAAEFILLDRAFPRSVVHGLDRAELSLRMLEPASDRTGVVDEARRVLGRARTHLEYTPLPLLLERLPQEMVAVQRACERASAAVGRRYFDTSGSTAWSQEAAL